MALTVAAQLAHKEYCYCLGQERELQGKEDDRSMSPLFGLINLPAAVVDSGCDVFVGSITRTSLYTRRQSILETLS
jgi:hypothetical protein